MLNKLFRSLLIVLVGAGLLTRSYVPLTDPVERVRAYTRSIEFDYVSWIADAFAVKITQGALGTAKYLSDDDQHAIALQYIQLVGQIQQAEARLNEMYTDPNVADPEAASAALRAELAGLYRTRQRLAPLAEGLIQDQVASVVAELDLTLAGQPVPPVLYHATPLPLALIVSPREVIQQDADISLVADLPLDEQVKLEGQVEKGLNVSALVVPVGGVGVYPTMVMQTTDINWLSEVVAHEWVHNWLTIRPLGASYLVSPELRIMNETTASIAGKEIGKIVIERYYPELVPAPPAPPQPSSSESPSEPAAPPAFDFNKEMHTTRVTADEMLKAGKIDEAEAYMEQRRQFIYEHGYHIRKLNQAYFAFYGAYADQPGGAAGADPVGTAVRALREQSATLAQFLNRISWMSSFDELQRAVSEGK